MNDLCKALSWTGGSGGGRFPLKFLFPPTNPSSLKPSSTPSKIDPPFGLGGFYFSFLLSCILFFFRDVLDSGIQLKSFVTIRGSTSLTTSAVLTILPTQTFQNSFLKKICKKKSGVGGQSESFTQLLFQIAKFFFYSAKFPSYRYHRLLFCTIGIGHQDTPTYL